MRPPDPHCIFCKIIRGEAPATIVDESTETLAFLDIRPFTPGHVLIVPKEHAASVGELSRPVGGRMFEEGMALAAALRRSGLKCEGVSFLLADGEAAGQEVFHVHLHVFPRYRGDGFGLRTGPQYGRIASREELDAIARRLRAAAGH